MQFVSPPPLPRLKIGSLLPGYPLSTPLTFQAKIRAVTALLNGVTASNRSCRNYAWDLLIHGVLPAFWVFPGSDHRPASPGSSPCRMGHIIALSVTALYSAITAIFGLISGLRPRLIYIDRSGTPAAAPHKTGLLQCYMERVLE